MLVKYYTLARLIMDNNGCLEFQEMIKSSFIVVFFSQKDLYPMTDPWDWYMLPTFTIKIKQM